MIELLLHTIQWTDQTNTTNAPWATSIRSTCYPLNRASYKKSYINGDSPP